MIHDVSNAIRFVKANDKKYHIDPENLIVWGETHGSYLGCLIGIYGGTGKIDDPDCPYKDCDSRVKAVIDYWAFTDFLTIYHERLNDPNRDPNVPLTEELIFRKTGKELEEELSKQLMPTEDICGSEPPFYILHGELDKNIPRRCSEIYYEKLKNAGVEAYLEIVKDTPHSLANYRYGWQIEGTYEFIHHIFGGKETE